MNLSADVMGYQPNDALRVGSRDDLSGVCQAAR
jgi:hypothetical protein